MKLHILGASGSGVTTLGNSLANELQITYFDSDDYFWLKTEPPFTRRRKPGDRNKLIIEDLNQSKHWILGGSIINWGENLFPSFDLIIFLYLPTELRIQRLKQRELEKYGSMIYTNEKRAKQFSQFLSWAADYDYNTGLANRTFKAHQNWLGQSKSPILKIIGNYSLTEKLDFVKKELLLKNIIDPDYI